MKPQASASHYDRGYYDRRRFYSLAVQVEMLGELAPGLVLEVGPALGVLAAAFRAVSGARVVTLDIDPTLRPTVLGSVFALPFADAAFDAGAVFQMLEHLPFDRFGPVLRELRRVCRVGVAVSLPDCTSVVTLRLGLRRARYDGFTAAWTLTPASSASRELERIPDGAGHYWEIGCKGTPLSVVRSAVAAAGWEIAKEVRTPENAYHHFFLLR